MAGSKSAFSEMVNAATAGAIEGLVNRGSKSLDGKTVFGVKLSPNDLERVSRVFTDAAGSIGPFLATSKEKTSAAAHGAPGVDKFEEQFNAAIDAIDKRQADARKRVKSNASDARDATTRAAASAKDVTTHAATSAREATAQAAASAKDATTLAATSAREATAHAAASAKDATTHAATSAREATAHAAASAREATAHAAAETADAGRNLFGLLFWLGAAGAVIYYLLLNEERREQVNDLAKSGANIARGIIVEVRGEDGVFGS